MSSAANFRQYTIFPRRYFDESKTWYAWNKLTIAEVYALREESGFEGQDIFFWLNHPIRLVRLVGIIVGIDLVGNGRYCLLTVDDSSGANIEVKIERTIRPAGGHGEYLSDTSLENMKVFVGLAAPAVVLDKKSVYIGAVIRVQGTIMKWCGERQLKAQRMAWVRDTNEEAVHWTNATNWKRDVLNRPWILTRQQQDAVDEIIRLGDRKHYDRTKMKRKAQAKHDQRQAVRQARIETERQTEEARMNAGALKGSEILPGFH